MSACLLFLIVQTFIVSLHPASFSTCAGCMPGLQTSLCVFPALATCHASLSDSLPHYPGNLSVFPTLHPYTTIPLQPDLFSKGQKSHRDPDIDTLKPLDPHILTRGEVLSVCKALGRRLRCSQGEQPQPNVISHFAALRHEIKQGIHCRRLKLFLWSVPLVASCLNSLTSPPCLWVCYQGLGEAVKQWREGKKTHLKAYTISMVSDWLLLEEDTYWWNLLVGSWDCWE